MMLLAKTILFRGAAYYIAFRRGRFSLISGQVDETPL
jgi:hypothetical protein